MDNTIADLEETTLRLKQVTEQLAEKEREQIELNNEIAGLKRAKDILSQEQLDQIKKCEIQFGTNMSRALGRDGELNITPISQPHHVPGMPPAIPPHNHLSSTSNTNNQTSTNPTLTARQRRHLQNQQDESSPTQYSDVEESPQSTANNREGRDQPVRDRQVRISSQENVNERVRRQSRVSESRGRDGKGKGKEREKGGKWWQFK